MFLSVPVPVPGKVVDGDEGGERAYMRANVVAEVDTVGPTIEELTTKLRDLGILLFLEQLQSSFSPEALKRRAHEFELWALKN